MSGDRESDDSKSSSSSSRSYTETSEDGGESDGRETGRVEEAEPALRIAEYEERWNAQFEDFDQDAIVPKTYGRWVERINVATERHDSKDGRVQDDPVTERTG